MKTLLVFLATTALVSGAASHADSALAVHPPTPPRLRILKASGPHVIVSRKTVITLYVRVTGIRLDAKHLGKAPRPGHGHIQVYLDRIPADAYGKRDMAGVVSVVAATTFSMSFPTSWIRLHPGRHKFVLALAQNDYVLLKAPSASFKITVA